MKEKKYSPLQRLLAVVMSLALVLSFVPVISAAAAPELKYPEANIDMLVGYKAGGGTYLSAQMLTNYNDIWGTAINLVEKAGSGGAIAADYVANAKADGYTTLFCTASLPISIVIAKDLKKAGTISLSHAEKEEAEAAAELPEEEIKSETAEKTEE